MNTKASGYPADAVHVLSGWITCYAAFSVELPMLYGFDIACSRAVVLFWPVSGSILTRVAMLLR